MSKWISVDDRLPESRQVIDVWCVPYANRETDADYTKTYGFMDKWGDCIDKVTHWMPLPEPPK